MKNLTQTQDDPKNIFHILKATKERFSKWIIFHMDGFSLVKVEKWAWAKLYKNVHSCTYDQLFELHCTANWHQHYQQFKEAIQGYLLILYCLNWGSWEKYRNCLATYYCLPRPSHVILFCMRFAWKRRKWPSLLSFACIKKC